MSKQYTLYIRVPTLPSHGKSCLELYASNYAANIWSEKPQYAVPFTRTMAKGICENSQSVRRLDVRMKEFPPIPESDAINGL